VHTDVCRGEVNLLCVCARARLRVCVLALACYYLKSIVIVLYIQFITNKLFDTQFKTCWQFEVLRRFSLPITLPQGFLSIVEGIMWWGRSQVFFGYCGFEFQIKVLPQPLEQLLKSLLKVNI